MSTSNKDNQVLLAILNVKKYAKNLKKKASNLQDPMDELNFIQAVSSPSFFQPRFTKEVNDLNSPLLFTKSSYNQSFESFVRKNKCNNLNDEEHSMTSIPMTKQNQRPYRKNSNVFIVEPSSPAKTYTYSSTKGNLNMSSKAQIGRYENDAGVKRQKQRKQASKTQIKIESRKNVNRQQQKQQKGSSNILQQQMASINSQMKVHITKQQEQKQKIKNLRNQDPKIIEQLLNEIENLKEEICNYKKALVIIKSKYLEMQQKCKQKVECDHLLDVLKRKIEILQRQKQSLNQTIKKQNEKICKFQSTIIEVANKFQLYFGQKINKIIKLQTQNQVYKQLLFAKTPVLNTDITKKQQIGIKQLIKEKNLKNCMKQNNGSQSESESQSYSYQKPLALSSNQICRTSKDLQTKYQKVQNK